MRAPTEEEEAGALSDDLRKQLSLQRAATRSTSFFQVAPRVPLRFTLRSYDRLCYLCMKVQWIDCGVEHTWRSWDDALCGYYQAVKLLPAHCTDIRVSFRSYPGGHHVRKVNRKKKCAWEHGEEVISFRKDGSFEPRGLDVLFELRGSLLTCYVHRAWNLRSDRREDWEHWSRGGPSQEALGVPSTLRTADMVFPSRIVEGMQGDESAAATVAMALARLKAASKALLEVRRRTQTVLLQLNGQVGKQWYAVNSSNTVAAGLAVASFPTLFLAPPVGVALGLGSAAVGVGATAGDVAGASHNGSRLGQVVLDDLWEQFGFEAIEAEFRETLQVAASSLHGPHSCYSAHGTAMAVGAASIRVGSVLARSAKLSRAVMATRAGAQGVANTVGKVLGGVGAGLAVGIAIHGWSTSTPNQKMVAEKLEEVERSLDYLELIAEQVDSALVCQLCEQPLEFGFSDQGIRRCAQFHCFHGRCLQEFAHGAGHCPSCPQASGSELTAVTSSKDRLRALLCLTGISRRTPTLDALSPRVLTRARQLASNLGSTRVRLRHGSRDLSHGLLEELLETENAIESSPYGSTSSRTRVAREDSFSHETWSEAVAAAGGIMELDAMELDGLLCGLHGMPIKYRLQLWPQWLKVQQRQASAAAQGMSYAALTKVEAPNTEVIAADIHRTGILPTVSELVPTLERVLTAYSAMNPDIGYGQGMNFIAAVFLKLGFEEETAFWMFAAVLEEIIPACHARDLEGLFRDTAVMDALLQTFLPIHATALDTVGLNLLWLCTDYFLSMGTKVGHLGIVVRLWDFILRHGPCGLFAGLLALLALYLPLQDDGTVEPHLDSEDMLAEFRKNLRDGTPQDVADAIMDILHEQQGGLSSQLVVELRCALTEKPLTMDSIPSDALKNAQRYAAWLCDFTSRGLSPKVDEEEWVDGDAVLNRLLYMKAPTDPTTPDSAAGSGEQSPDSPARSPSPAGSPRSEGPRRRKRTSGLRLKDTKRLSADSQISGTSMRTSSFAYVEQEDDSLSAEWQAAIEEAGGASELTAEVVEALLMQGNPVPKHLRLELWPKWLRVDFRRSRGQDEGFTYSSILEDASIGKAPSQPREPDTLWNADAMSVNAKASKVADAVRTVHKQYVTADLRIEMCQRGLLGIARLLLCEGFSEEDAFWITLTIAEDVRPSHRQSDLEGVFRDTAVADVLLHCVLPAHAAALASAGLPLLALTADFFMGLACEGPAQLPTMAALCDYLFLRGESALFSCFLAQIDLCLPLHQEDKDNANDLLRTYQGELESLDAGDVLRQLTRFGGAAVSLDVIQGLRHAVGSNLLLCG